MTDAELVLAVCAVVGGVYLLMTDDGGAVSGSGPAPLVASPSVDRNYASVVADAKAQLEATGADLSGPCGAFQITRLSAQMVGGDCGILSKPGGNNCEGFAVDIHIFRDGLHYDVLGDGGGANSPQYSLVGLIDDPNRWRQP